MQVIIVIRICFQTLKFVTIHSLYHKVCNGPLCFCKGSEMFRTIIYLLPHESLRIKGTVIRYVNCYYTFLFDGIRIRVHIGIT